MKRLLLASTLFFSVCSFARTINAKNIDELNAANKNARPGDTVVLQNGTWNNVLIRLNAKGTEEHPIVFRAQTPGKVMISGASQLRLGGEYLVVDGWLFTKGYAPVGSVIDFRINDQQLANHCRITNCVVDDFNKPKRMQEDYWVSFSGKHNRVDHCTFRNKKNLGVLIAVILDDERSRENFHSIDHNYFGVRPPLASNAGEIIRVGVSEYCQFNSNTQIVDNFFEHCDGETEVVSIKSCSNVVRNNLLKECQGDMVLRHGNYNTVENNIFLGNGKEGTGGVRIINKGQWVVNNFFYRCRGVAFRSPLSLMNGIPNSPAFRYVQVTDAVVANNSFYDCTPISFCEGSDTERTLPPSNVVFAKNIFYNTTDSLIYRVFDNTSGIRFADNKVSSAVPQQVAPGFEKVSLKIADASVAPLPTDGKGAHAPWIDSLRKIANGRPFGFSADPGFSGATLIKQVTENAYHACGAQWFDAKAVVTLPNISVNCKTTTDVYNALSKQQGSNITIRLTGTQYSFDRPLFIDGNVSFTAAKKDAMQIATTQQLPGLFVIRGKGSLTVNGLNVSGAQIQAQSLIATDTAGSSEHYNLVVRNNAFSGLKNCTQIFTAHKATVADSIVLRNNVFDGAAGGFALNEETQNKGYYNVEKMYVTNNSFHDLSGALLDLYRGGNDESTMGPDLHFTGNHILQCNAGGPLVKLTGVQKTDISSNVFRDCNAAGVLIEYRDIVRAVHLLSNNLLSHSGSIRKDVFVTEKQNTIQ